MRVTSTPIPQGFVATKRRVRRKRRTGAPLSPTLPALQVVAVEGVFYDEPLLQFTLVLNTTAEDPLVVDTLDPANWTAVYQGVEFTGYEVEVSAFNRVFVIVQSGGATPGPDSVSYAADPADVRDTGGRTLAAFSDFPLE